MSDFYIIGTKYETSPNGWRDMFPEMVRTGGVSVGFASGLDLSRLYGRPESEIVEYLRANGERSASYSALKKFLNIQPGDLIALKGFGAPKGHEPRLTIVGYAVAVEQGGIVYRYSGPPLGHLINVEFIETDTSRLLSLGYGQTVHRLTNKEHIRKIFGLYQRAASKRSSKRVNRKGTKRKNLRQVTVRSRSYITGVLHNRIQQSYYEHLCKKYPSQTVTMEAGFVDIRIEEPDCVTFIEVKPFITARQCIREAVGQLLEYSWRVPRDKGKRLKLVILGPNRITAEERRFLRHINQHARLSFAYKHWSRMTKS